jgi:hypothetical protein
MEEENEELGAEVVNGPEYNQDLDLDRDLPPLLLPPSASRPQPSAGTLQACKFASQGLEEIGQQLKLSEDNDQQEQPPHGEKTKTISGWKRLANNQE